MSIKKIDKEYLKSLSEDIMINFTDEELDEILISENTILSLFNKVLKIDTNNIEPAFYPFDIQNTYLREDEEISVLKQDEVLKNAPEKKDECISICRVVK